MTFFLVFTPFWARNWSSGKRWPFFLVFTLLHFIVVGKDLGNREGVSNLLNHPPQSQKMVNFAESFPPTLKIDLHPCSDIFESMARALNCFVKNFLGYFLWQVATFFVDLSYKPPKNLATLIKSSLLSVVRQWFPTVGTRTTSDMRLSNRWYASWSYFIRWKLLF